MAYLKVKDAPQFVRDTHSKAILNTDRSSLEEYYTERAIAKKKQLEEEKTVNRIGQLEQDMQEIKQLLYKLAANQEK
jgi:hypothetical protein